MEWGDLLLVDKPTGITSFDVIRRLRRMYSAEHVGARPPKLGHAGTLDPAASGLMLIGCGAGTKALEQYLKLDKEYVAEILLGTKTTTGDKEGEVLERCTVAISAALSSQIATAVANFSGPHTLPVSAYSAIKKDGVPMYKRARAAAARKEVVSEVPVRTMVVHEAELLKVDRFETEYGPQVLITVRFLVASGTYIRSLAEEFGRQLGYPASLWSLNRTKVGEFRLTDAQSLN